MKDKKKRKKDLWDVTIEVWPLVCFVLFIFEPLPRYILILVLGYLSILIMYIVSEIVKLLISGEE